MLKRKIGYFVILLVLISGVINGQPDISVPGELERLYTRLSKTSNDSLRIQINDSIITLVDNYVKCDTIFAHKLSNVKYLGQITSPDSLLKIVTWNLFLYDYPGRYFAYIIKKQQDGNPNLIYRLTAEYRADDIKADTTYSAEKWYGALYYDIRPQIIKGLQCWMLLGIDYGNPDITRKIIETITFDNRGNIRFGLNSITASDTVRYRVVFEYSSSATMTLRFAGDDSIIFDHLVPFSPELAGDRKYYGPQYSNDAYVLEGGLWKFKLNVDARNIDR